MEKSNVYQRRTRKGSKNKYNLAYTKMDMWSYYCNNRDKKKAIALRQDVYRKVINAIMDGIMDKYLRLGRVSLGANIGFIELRKRKAACGATRMVRFTQTIQLTTRVQSRRGSAVRSGSVVSI